MSVTEKSAKVKDNNTDDGKDATTSNDVTSKDGLGSPGRAKAAVSLEEAKDESVSANIKKVCYERGVFKADGFLDHKLLLKCFKDGYLDIADFKSGLQ